MDRKLELLLKASTSVMNGDDLGKILMILTDVTKELLDAERCSIFIHDKIKKELWTLIADGVDPIHIPEDKGLVGYVYQSGEPLNIQNAYEDSRFDSSVDHETGFHTTTVLCAPLRNGKGECLGVFEVMNKREGEYFNEEDLSLLNHLSLYIATNLENKLLHDKLKQTQKDVIYRLSYATKFKDPETMNHIIRVGLFAANMAKKLGWEDGRIELLQLSAPMHDIGKVGIPDAVLQKSKALNVEEWKIMKQHTIYGYDILKNSGSELMDMAAVIALDHHEKWDGSGYPVGKKTTDISIEGRLTAISDVFDALTSKRYYKEAWSYEETFDFLKGERGKHFDPELIDVFIETSNDVVRIKEAYCDEE